MDNLVKNAVSMYDALQSSDNPDISSAPAQQLRNDNNNNNINSKASSSSSIEVRQKYNENSFSYVNHKSNNYVEDDRRVTNASLEIIRREKSSVEYRQSLDASLLFELKDKIGSLSLNDDQDDAKTEKSDFLDASDKTYNLDTSNKTYNLDESHDSDVIFLGTSSPKLENFENTICLSSDEENSTFERVLKHRDSAFLVKPRLGRIVEDSRHTSLYDNYSDKVEPTINAVLNNFNMPFLLIDCILLVLFFYLFFLLLTNVVDK